ncbi:hypothetical protein DFS33DRAFT_1278516 [Desarmillaria ectypa]|nr:hypothetical protein DFS33DRAFT_1278516 [Desarmillaria ectypa]
MTCTSSSEKRRQKESEGFLFDTEKFSSMCIHHDSKKAKLKDALLVTVTVTNAFTPLAVPVWFRMFFVHKLLIGTGTLGQNWKYAGVQGRKALLIHHLSKVRCIGIATIMENMQIFVRMRLNFSKFMVPKAVGRDLNSSTNILEQGVDVGDDEIFESVFEPIQVEIVNLESKTRPLTGPELTMNPGETGRDIGIRVIKKENIAGVYIAHLYSIAGINISWRNIEHDSHKYGA